MFKVSHTAPLIGYQEYRTEILGMLEAPTILGCLGDTCLPVSPCSGPLLDAAGVCFAGPLGWYRFQMVSKWTRQSKGASK